MTKLIESLKALVAALKNYVNKMPPQAPQPTPQPTHVSKIPLLAQAIFEAEGNGKQAGMKYNNPGDLRGFPGNQYLKSLGATGYGENNLAIFPTLEIGQQACVQLCTDAATGKLKAYQSTDTIRQFVHTYADPVSLLAWDNYCSIITKWTKVDETTQIRELL